MKSDITLWPSGKIVSVDSNKSLFTELKAQGVHINSSCGGCATCALCVVVVKSGDEYLNEPTFEEKQLLGNVFHITKERLSCQTYARGPVTLDITIHDEKAAELGIKSKVVRRTKEEKEILANTPKPVVTRPPKEGGMRRPKKFKQSEE